MFKWFWTIFLLGAPEVCIPNVMQVRSLLVKKTDIVVSTFFYQGPRRGKGPGGSADPMPSPFARNMKIYFKKFFTKYGFLDTRPRIGFLTHVLIVYNIE